MSPKLLAVLFFAVAIACDSHDSARAAKGSRTKCDVTVRNNSQKRILECRVDCGLGDVDLFGNMPPSALKEDGDLPALSGSSVNVEWEFEGETTSHRATNVLGRGVKPREIFTIEITGDAAKAVPGR
jgi:hypothetical protein